MNYKYILLILLIGAVIIYGDLFLFKAGDWFKNKKKIVFLDNLVPGYLRISKEKIVREFQKETKEIKRETLKLKNLLKGNLILKFKKFLNLDYFKQKFILIKCLLTKP